MLVDLKMCSALSMYRGPINYTYMCEASNHYSCIDDIWVNGGHNDVMDVSHVEVLDDVENFSDHCAVVC